MCILGIPKEFHFKISNLLLFLVIPEILRDCSFGTSVISQVCWEIAMDFLAWQSVAEREIGRENKSQSLVLPYYFYLFP